MQIDKRIESEILEVANHLGLPVCLLDETGRVLVAGGGWAEENDLWLDSADFVDGVARVADARRTYFLLESDNNRPLRIMIPYISGEIDRYGFLIVSWLTEILKSTIKKPGKEEVFRRIMLDRISPLDLQEAIRDYNIDADHERCIIIIQSFGGDAVSIYNALLKVFPRQSKDVVVNLNRYVVAVVKYLDDDNDMDSVVQLVKALESTINDELSVNSCIGVGNIKKGLLNIRDSFQEGQEAINLGMMQKTKGKIFFFQKLLLERFLQDVPRDIRKRFFDLANSDALKKVLTEEMLETINKFFENSLNLSEAARRLYIHRNTLIYRLEKLQKVTGLDLRNFEDAVLLKIIIMLGKSLSSNNRME